jgi:hypothetical protein
MTVILACNSFSISAQSSLEPQADNKENEVPAVPTVPEGKDPQSNICAMCHEKFKFIFNDELEEWHLLGAVRVDGKTFHPGCC